MKRLLESPVHLACIAGPDVGALIPVWAQWSHIGRTNENINDPLTSREHCRVRAVSTKRRLSVELVDEGTINGIRTGPQWHPLPGFASTWVALRTRRQAVVPIGTIVLVGSNLFEVRELPAPLALDLLVSHEDFHRSASWRPWMLAVPILSFTWLIARLLSWAIASLVFGGTLVIALYVYTAWRSHQHVIDPLRILYGLELPASLNVTNSPTRTPLDLTPSRPHMLMHAGSWSFARLPRHTVDQEKSVTVPGRARIGIRGDATWISWIGAQLVVATRQRGVSCEFDGSSVRNGDDEIYRLGTLNAAEEWDIVVTLSEAPPVRRIRQMNALTDTEIFPDYIGVGDLDEAHNRSGAGLTVTIGCDSEGPVAINLVSDGPHALVAGTTGSGKSEALRTWIYQLARRYPPRRLRFVFVDYKGGATFGDLAYLPHCEGVVTDLDAHLTERAICGLSVELTERESLLAERGYVNLEQWESHDAEDAPARIICIIDEFRAMIRTHPGLIERFIDVAARGRSLGIHLIAATQSPGGVVSAHMRANLTLRVCFRTAQTAESVDVLGTAEAAHLPRIPGRARISDRGLPVQWAYTDQRDIKAVTRAERSEPTLWKQPLPVNLCSSKADSITSGKSGHVIAVADDIDSRRYVSLVAERGPVQVVAEGDTKVRILDMLRTQFSPAIRLTECTTAVTDVPIDDGEAVLHAIRVSRLTHAPILIDDISRVIRGIDSVGGAGSGTEWWKMVATTHQALMMVGTDVNDMSRYESDRRLISVSYARAKARAFERTFTDLLETLSHRGSDLPVIASGWNLSSPCSVALVKGSGRTESPSWGTLLATEQFDQQFHRRLVNAGNMIARYSGENVTTFAPQSIDILGQVPEPIERICHATAPTRRLSDHEVTEYDVDKDSAIAVLGVLNAHTYRRLKCPLGVRPGAHIWVKWRGWWHKFDK